MTDKKPIDELKAAVKLMKPGAVMEFMAKQFGMKVPEFLQKYSGSIAALAVKNGWVKAKEISGAVKDFNKKNVKDNTEIDFENAEIDEDTFKLECFLDGDTGKTLTNFVKEYQAGMKDAEKQIAEQEKKLKDDVKKAKVDISDESLEENGATVANVIDAKGNKGKSGKEMTKAVETAIKAKDKIAEIAKKQAENEKSLNKIKLNSKIEKMSISELIKMFDRLNNKKSQKNESLNKTTLNEADNPVSLDNVAAAMAIKTVELIKNNDEVDKKSALESLMSWVKKAAEEMDYDSDMTDELQEQTQAVFDAARNGKDMASIAKDFTTDTAMKVAEKMASVDIENPTNIELDQYSFKGVKKLATIISKGIDGEIEDMMSNDTISGNNIHGFSADTAITKASKALGMKDKDIINMFARSNSSISKNIAKKKLGLKLSKFLVDYDKNPDKAVKALVAGANTDQKDALSEIAAKLKPDSVKNFKNAGITVDGAVKKMSANFDVTNAAISDTGLVFDHSIVDKELDDLDDIFDDGKVSPEELKKFESFGKRMDGWSKWALEHQNDSDPNVQARIQLIHNAELRYKELAEDNESVLDSASEARTGVDSSTAKAAAKIPKTSEQKSLWQKIKGSGTGLGWAIVAARTTGIILNKGKDVTNAIAAQAMKHKEDAGVIASLNVKINNGKDSDTKYSDTEFSVRFDANDLKWHATCIDNRKMKFPEDIIIKKVLDTETGKKFKQYCINKWSKYFGKDAGDNAVIQFVINNGKKMGLKFDVPGKFVKAIKSLADNFDNIQKEFK